MNKRMSPPVDVSFSCFSFFPLALLLNVLRCQFLSINFIIIISPLNNTRQLDEENQRLHLSYSQNKKSRAATILMPGLNLSCNANIHINVAEIQK